MLVQCQCTRPQMAPLGDRVLVKPLEDKPVRCRYSLHIPMVHVPKVVYSNLQ